MQEGTVLTSTCRMCTIARVCRRWQLAFQSCDGVSGCFQKPQKYRKSPWLHLFCPAPREAPEQKVADVMLSMRSCRTVQTASQTFLTPL